MEPSDQKVRIGGEKLPLNSKQQRCSALERNTVCLQRRGHRCKLQQVLLNGVTMQLSEE
jgi:hypothetical protein